ncbi:MAG: T9SS type A sorting domain-containing protein [Flavobacteriales bacterium]|nr:T9SS type A sorting domain-containing protein [Flavobacteriales bacterium]
MIKKLLSFCYVTIVVATLPFTINAQNFDQSILTQNFSGVIPNAYASTTGTTSFVGPLTNTARTYQMLIAASELTEFVNKELTGLQFRLQSSQATAWPTSEITFASYDVYLSGCVNPANRSFTFSENVVGNQTQVRTGSYTIPIESFPGGGNPNGFGANIAFNTNYLYTGGNLLIEIRHSGSSGTSRSNDAIGTAITGYGTAFSACWTGSYTGTAGVQGNFSVIQLNTNSPLSVLENNKNTVRVFPNPTTEKLHIQHEQNLENWYLYNIYGQLMMQGKVSSNLFTLDVTTLNTGTYLLQLSDGESISTHKILKK